MCSMSTISKVFVFFGRAKAVHFGILTYEGTFTVISIGCIEYKIIFRHSDRASYDIHVVLFCKGAEQRFCSFPISVGNRN